MNATQLKQLEDQRWKAADQREADAKLTANDHHLTLAEKTAFCISKPPHHD
jgi:hypothetical protein